MTDAARHSLIFKRVRDTRTNDGPEIQIPLDVYLPNQGHSSRPGPAIPLVWVHTGGYLQGTRSFIPQHLVRACNRLNLVLVAPDYRLAPQVAMEDVLQDVADAVRFTLSDGFPSQIARLDPSVQVDNSRYIFAGSSAGGWASLLLGLGLVNVQPDQPSLPVPLAVISIYPITTVTQARAPYYHKPLRPLPFAYAPHAKVGDPIPVDLLQEHLSVSGPILTEAPPTILTSRAPLYTYSRQEGNFTDLIFRPDGKLSPEATCVPSLVGEKFGQGAASQDKLPKLISLIVGDADVFVEPDQSYQAIEAFRSIPSIASSDIVQLHTVPGKNHLWDIFDAEADIPELWSRVESLLQSEAS